MLEIDLSSGKSHVSDISSLFDEYLGGTGVATKLLHDLPHEYDPYAPEAPIFLAIGPFSSVFPVATKTVALFKSPLNGNLGESHAGGRLALSMYGAGFHVIKIVGAAPEPSYVVINNDGVEIRRAHSLKGMSALAVERVLRDREGSPYKRSIIRIGPAGERRSPIAAVTVDSSRHFGRLGLGGVFGSKNLKALVISGGAAWAIPDKAKYNKYYKKVYDIVVGSSTMRKYHDLGTAVNVVPLSKIHGMPTRNFRQGFFEGAPDISGEKFADKHLCQQIACAHCQVGCIHMASLRENFSKDEHQFKTFKVSYDHELIFAWGSNLSIQSTEEILRLLLIVEKQGWDAISMGVTLAWATQAFQEGLIGKAQLGDLVLNFGDGAAYERALGHIKDGTNGFFRDLEKGAAFCAARYGGRDFAIAFGGNEAPGYVTGLYAFLGYATGVRHSHLDSAGYSVDQNNLVKPSSEEAMTRKLYGESVSRMISNALVICLFARNVYSPEVISEGLEVLGMPDWTEERLNRAARRIHALKNAYKMKCGFRFEDLYLPAQLTRVSTTNGMLTQEAFNREIQRFKSLLQEDFAEAGLSFPA
jgi:aldehyde:ferredoxin oxidoreductase